MILQDNATKNNKKDSLYRNASIIAITSSSISSLIKIKELREEKQNNITTKKVIANGICVAAKEGVKYIISRQIKNTFTTNKVNTITNNAQHGLKHGLKTCGGAILNVGFQVAVKSASDIIKLRNGQIESKECFNNIKKHTLTITSAFVVARGCAIIGGMIAPGIGAVACGVAGVYLGEYVGKKISKQCIK